MGRFLIFLVALSGCTINANPSLDSAPDKQLYLGAVFVKTSVSDEQTALRRIDTAGIWAGKSSFGAGYKGTKVIIIDDDCQVVFIVNSKDQLSESISLLKSTLGISGGEICVSS